MITHYDTFAARGRAHARGVLDWLQTAGKMQGCVTARSSRGWRSRAPVALSLILETQPAIKRAHLITHYEPFAARGRAHGRGALGGVRTAEDKRGQVEGKKEDLVALKSTGRVVLRSRTCPAPSRAPAHTP